MRFEECLVEALAEQLGVGACEIRSKVRAALRCTVERLVQEPVVYGWAMAVSKAYKLDGLQIYSETRRQPIAEARQVAMYLAANEGNVQHGAIASHFGCGKKNVDYTRLKIDGLIGFDRALHNAVQSSKIIYNEANPTSTEDSDEAEGRRVEKNPAKEGICKAQG